MNYGEFTVNCRTRQERERSSLLAAGRRQRVTVDKPLTPFNRIGLWQRRNTDNRQRLRGKHRLRCFSSETLCRSSVFFFAVADKDFYDRSLTYRFIAVHEPRQWCAAFLRCRHITDSPFRDWAVPFFRNVFQRRLSSRVQYTYLTAWQ